MQWALDLPKDNLGGNSLARSYVKIYTRSQQRSASRK